MCASTPVVTPRCGFNMLKEKRENGPAIVVRLSSFIIAVKGIRETELLPIVTSLYFFFFFSSVVPFVYSYDSCDVGPGASEMSFYMG